MSINAEMMRGATGHGEDVLIKLELSQVNKVIEAHLKNIVDGGVITDKYFTVINLPHDISTRVMYILDREYTDKGFTFVYFPSDSGDSREPLDYGTPARIRLEW